MKRLLIMMCGILTCLVVPAAHAQTLDKIESRNVIVVGVKADYRPFGFLDPSGEIVGMEPDLAQDIADRLGVELEMVPVQSANRTEFLKQGRIDLILATMSDNPQRREASGVIEPPYYAGGTAILLPKSLSLTDWSQLKGLDICGTQGAYYNRNVSQKYGANVIAFAGTVEAQNALLAGACTGFLQDSTLISGMLLSGDERWSEFEAPLPVEDPQPWVMAVPLAERDGPYGEAIAKIVQDWHASGTLIKLEEKWGLPASDYLQQMQTQFSK